MRAAIAAGARMINDITALRHDPDSLAVAGASGLPVVLMHSQGEPATMQRRPRYACAPARRLRSPRAARRSLGRGRLRAPPAAGRSRHRLRQDASPTTSTILSRLGLYLGLGVPLLLGVSRKSFIARLAGEAPASERLPGSLAAALAGVAQGVAMLRVHDVAATRQALRVWQALHVLRLAEAPSRSCDRCEYPVALDFGPMVVGELPGQNV